MPRSAAIPRRCNNLRLPIKRIGCMSISAEGMTMRWRWLAVCLALLSSPSAHAVDCDDQTAIWTTAERDGVSHRLYHRGGVFFIEEWRKGKRAWRTLASW